MWISGPFGPKRVVLMQRNHWSFWTEIGGPFAPKSADTDANEQVIKLLVKIKKNPNNLENINKNKVDLLNKFILKLNKLKNAHKEYKEDIEAILMK